MMYPPAQPRVTTRKYRPLPFRPSQSRNRNGISSPGLSPTPTDRSAQRTSGSSTKLSKHDDIVEARVSSKSEIISDHTLANGIIVYSYILEVA